MRYHAYRPQNSGERSSAPWFDEKSGMKMQSGKKSGIFGEKSGENEEKIGIDTAGIDTATGLLGIQPSSDLAFCKHLENKRNKQLRLQDADVGRYMLK